jgi:hypothetical protein
VTHHGTKFSQAPGNRKTGGSAPPLDSNEVERWREGERLRKVANHLCLDRPFEGPRRNDAFAGENHLRCRQRSGCFPWLCCGHPNMMARRDGFVQGESQSHFKKPQNILGHKSTSWRAVTRQSSPCTKKLFAPSMVDIQEMFPLNVAIIKTRTDGEGVFASWRWFCFRFWIQTGASLTSSLPFLIASFS